MFYPLCTNESWLSVERKRSRQPGHGPGANGSGGSFAPGLRLPGHAGPRSRRPRCQTANVSEPDIRRLDSTNAFIVVDLPGAPRADGVVRCARKVLVDSTKSLARSRTYSWAVLAQKVSGASAAINAEGEDRPAAIGAFCAETAPQVADGSLTLSPGKGLTPADLDALGGIPSPDPEAFVAGIIGCVRAATGSHAVATAAVEFDGGVGKLLHEALAAEGIEVLASGSDALGTPADVLLFGSRPGVVEHTVAGQLPHRLLVPTAPMAFTPRALAVATRNGATVLPDFVTTAGELASRSGSDPGSALAEVTERALAHEEGAVLGACRAAEEFILSWRDDLPFGRPIG